MSGHKSTKKGSNIICRVSNVTPEMVCSYVKRMPKQKMKEDAFRDIMGKSWFQNEHQAPEQWGLYYIDGTYYYPRFDHDITIGEAEAYLYHWMRNLIVINPYTRFKKQCNKNLVESIVGQLEKNPNEHDLKTIIGKIIDSDEPFVINEIIANALNNYSRVLKVETINKDNEQFNVSLIPNYKEILKAQYNMTKKEYFELFDSVKTAFDPSSPIQQIYYGAPGTGKSHAINRETKGHETFRTTFHPDSDYSTFVGAYKPVMEEAETRVVPVVLNNGASFDQNYGTLKEKKISYKFVKQAFLKAYIAAWRTFANTTLASTIQTTGITLTNKTENDSWILNEVTDNEVRYTKMSIIDVAKYETLVKNYWETWCNADEPESFGPGNSDLYQATPCVWYKKKHDPNMETSAEDCWNAIIDYLKEGNHIDETPRKQLYRVTFDEDYIKIYSNANANLDNIKKKYEEQKGAINIVNNSDSVQTNIANKILSDYRSATTFEEAWEELEREVNTPPTLAPAKAPAKAGSISVPPVFLIVEEINRGNCAQIFGDLFQLLDRKEGFSQYPIHADEDIRKCLVSEHTDEDPSFGTNGLDFTPEQVALINQVLDCEDNVAVKIARGEVLVLPPNLYIWATMNTSDQSLFPIDSAFKRRWDWKYIPIEYDKENWVFEVGGKHYNWGEFLSKINPEIYTITESPDKQMGYYFAKANPTTGIISQDTLLNKVLFYLWTDVFKDYDVASTVFKNKKTNRAFRFTDFFEDDEALDNFIENMGLVSEDGPVSGDAESI